MTIDTTRRRTFDPVLVETHDGPPGSMGAGIAIDARRLQACLRFITRHFTKSRRRRDADTLDLRLREPDLEAIRRVCGPHLDAQQAEDNVVAWVAAGRILHDVEDHHGAADGSLWNAILAYLFDTWVQLTPDQQRAAGARWDIQDVQAEVDDLAARHGFHPRYPIQPQMTQTDPDPDFPMPQIPEGPITTLPAPVMRSQASPTGPPSSEGIP